MQQEFGGTLVFIPFLYFYSKIPWGWVHGTVRGVQVSGSVGRQKEDRKGEAPSGDHWDCQVWPRQRVCTVPHTPTKTPQLSEDLHSFVCTMFKLLLPTFNLFSYPDQLYLFYIFVAHSTQAFLGLQYLLRVSGVGLLSPSSGRAWWLQQIMSV